MRAKNERISRIHQVSIFLMLLAFISCQVTKPEEGGDLQIVLSSPAGASLAKSDVRRLTNLHIILERAGHLERETLIEEKDGYFRTSITELVPDTAYELILLAGITDYTLDAYGEADSIAILPNETTTVELELSTMIPELQMPLQDDICTGPEVIFSWNACRYAKGYILFIATDPLFRQTYRIETGLNENIYMLTGVTDPVLLYWKVASMHEKGGSSQWSEVRNVQIN